MIRLKLFLFLSLSLSLVQCSDFKDVFTSADNTSVKSSSKTPDESVETASKATENQNVATDSDFREAITTREGTYYFVKPNDTLTSIAAQYKVSGIALAHVNDMLYESSLPVGRRIFIPNKKKLSKYIDKKLLKSHMAQGQSNKKKDKADGKTIAKQQGAGFIWPTGKGEVTSGYGMRRGRPHDGIDIGVPSGTPVLSVADGEVLFAEYFSAYGKLILIKHKNGYFTAYAHNRKFLVSKGQKVKQGQTIAESGKTGRATGPHVHFEVHKKGGVKIDPMSVLPPKS